MKKKLVVNNFVVVVFSMAVGLYAGGRIQQKKDNEKWDFIKTIIRLDDDDIYLRTIIDFESSENIHNGSDSTCMFFLSFLEACVNENPNAYREAYEYSDIFGSKRISLKCLQIGAEHDDPRCLSTYAALYKETGHLDSSIVMLKKRQNIIYKDTLDYIEQRGGKTVIGTITNVRELSAYTGFYIFLYEFKNNSETFEDTFLWDDSFAIGDTIKISYDSINPRSSVPVI